MVGWNDAVRETARLSVWIFQLTGGAAAVTVVIVAIVALFGILSVVWVVERAITTARTSHDDLLLDVLLPQVDDRDFE